MAAITQDQITAALKKLGPSRPGELADHLQVEGQALKYHLKKMLDAGTLKAAGFTGSRRIALPEQKLDETGTPPPSAQEAEGHQRQEAPQGIAPERATDHAARRALHPGRRCRQAPAHRQRRRADRFHRRADAGDRRAALPTLPSLRGHR